jgi:hypothetical protein
MTKPRKSKRNRKTRRGGNGCKLNIETPFEGKQMGGGLHFSELEPKLIGGKLEGYSLNAEEPKLIGGYKKRRRTVKRVRRGGSSLGGMFGGMTTITDTINSLFDTKF